MTNLDKNTETAGAKWTIVDVVLIFLISLFLGGLAAALFNALFHNAATVVCLIRYFQGVVGILLPILWLYMRHASSPRDLGIKKSTELSVPIALLVGILLATAYFFLYMLVTSRSMLNLETLVTGDALVRRMLQPFTFEMLPIVVIVPLAEEIFFRGVLYGYLRSKMGILTAIFVQGALFSLTHALNLLVGRSTTFFDFLNYLIIGVLLGFLLQVSRSLFPSFMFHITYNYLNILWTMGK